MLHKSRKISAPRGFEGVSVDIGESICCISVASKTSNAIHWTIPIGSDQFDECITVHMQQAHHLVINRRLAEEIRIRIGSACPLDPELTMDVKGRDDDSGIPKMAGITSEDVRVALQAPLDAIIESLKTVLERRPTNSSAKVKKQGILLKGTGTCLRGLDRLIAEATGLPVRYESSGSLQ